LGSVDKEISKWEDACVSGQRQTDVNRRKQTSSHCYKTNCARLEYLFLDIKLIIHWSTRV